LPKRDRTGEAVETVSRRMMRVLEIIDETIDIGVGMAQYTPDELRTRVRGAKGGDMTKLVETLGEDAVIELGRN
jgi:hypothetical protein